jgi:hypothetical protein
LRVPLRTRGVVAGLATLIAGPAVALGVGRTSPAEIPSAARTAPESAVVTIGRAIPVRDPELQRTASTPTPVPSPTATPAPPPPRPSPRAVPVPPPPPPVPAGSIEGIIRAAASRWSVSGDWLVKIARCESGLNPRAYNPAGPYYGLFQFLLSTFRGNGGTDIWDPYQQADIAAKMIAHGQAHQWGCA